MESTFFWAQVIGFVAMSISISAWQVKKSRLILMIGVPSSLLWAIQYIMLGAPIAAIMNLANITKDGFLIFANESIARFVIIGFFIFIAVQSALNFANWYDILPFLGMAIGNMALFYDRDNKALFARAVILCQVCWFIYNTIVGAYMGTICSTLVATSAIIGMYRHEGWEIGRCYRTFVPSLTRALFVFPNFRTFP